jgi:malonyl-CoA/methylmalonyl-CoA synthetase
LPASPSNEKSLNPIVNDSPIDWVRRVAASDPNRPCIALPTGRAVTYAEIESAADAFAQACADLGVAAGDRVAVQVEKSVEAVALYLACLAAGAIYVPLNPDATLSEFEYVVSDATPKLAVMDQQKFSAVLPLARRAGFALESLGAEGDGTLVELARACARETPPYRSSPSDLAALIYTSGTTGRPKGAMLTIGNLASNAAALAATWRISASDVLLHALPLCHVHGLFAALNPLLHAGGSLILMRKFDAGDVINLLPRVTVLMGVPTFYTRLLSAGISRESAAHIRLFVSGSAPLLPGTHHAFAHQTGAEIIERYGMTETLINASHLYEGPRTPGSVGRALPGVEIRARRADGVLAGIGEVGTLEVRGPNVFAGYWDDPARTRSELRADGYFVTGDLGTIDAAGYISIIGRSKDLVISGGYNVYPKEVEAALDALPGIRESAVIGVPHPDLGEAVTAVVTVEPGAVLEEQAIVARLADSLARYKLPKRVIQVPELPRNAMGKVQKVILREQYSGLCSPPAPAQ